MAEKKMVNQKVAVGLGMVCLILTVGLIVAVATYLPTGAQIDSLNTQLSEKNQAISSLNLQVAALQSQISSLNSSTSNVESLQSQISTLEQQIDGLNNLLYLNASAYLLNAQEVSLQPYTNATIWDQPDAPFPYAGYVTVQVQSSSNLTYVQLNYNAFNVTYDNVVEVGNSTATFPVLPGQITIVLGNTELTDSVIATVTAIYYY